MNGAAVQPVRSRPWSLATRLMLAQAIVLTAGAATAAVIAGLVGPPLFHQHLLEAGHAASSPELEHIERAYASANAVTLAAALAIAFCAAAAVTWFSTRRLTTPLTQMANAAARLSQGDYSGRLPSSASSAGPELDRLATAFNDAAVRLEATEETRRRLLADVAHELRTPLATIAAYVDGLEDGVIEWGDDAARVLRDYTERLTRLADDMAIVSRAEEQQPALDPERVGIGEVVEAAVETMRDRYHAKGVDLVTHAQPAVVRGRRHDHREPADVEVELDRARILQVLTNLLTNALRHTPAHGTVTVAARQDGDTLVVSVTDTGEGMTAEQVPHVFERFYRGDTARSRDSGGSGIGLTIARSIAAAHGGSLEACSDGLGQGSTFRLTLPLTQGR